MTQSSGGGNGVSFSWRGRIVWGVEAGSDNTASCWRKKGKGKEAGKERKGGWDGGRDRRREGRREGGWEGGMNWGLKTPSGAAWKDPYHRGCSLSLILGSRKPTPTGVLWPPCASHHTHIPYAHHTHTHTTRARAHTLRLKITNLETHNLFTLEYISNLCWVSLGISKLYHQHVLTLLNCESQAKKLESCFVFGICT